MNESEQKGFDICIGQETYKGDPYYATKAEKEANRATIGYGMCWYPSGTQVLITDPHLTESQSRDFFTQLWNKKKDYALRKIGLAKTFDSQLGALISFLYWSGEGNFSRSQLLAYHIKGDYAQAAREFISKTWTSQGGQELGGLVRRRKLERDLYMSEVKLA